MSEETLKSSIGWDIFDLEDDLLLSPEHIDGLVPTPGQYHIVPVNDLFPHLTSPTCWCHPEPDEDDDGSVIYQHNSADQREHYESGRLLRH